MKIADYYLFEKIKNANPYHIAKIITDFAKSNGYKLTNAQRDAILDALETKMLTDELRWKIHTTMSSYL